MQANKVTDYAKVKKVREAVIGIDTLPTVPATVEKILSMLDNDRTSARDLETIIKYDQSLSAKILSVANSAFYGLPIRVTTVTRAVVAIGFTEVKNLALSVALMDFFKSKVKFPGFDVNGFWLHSIGVGIVSRMIARAYPSANPESLFTCGIMHDVGRVALCAYFPDLFREILDVKAKENCTMYEAEERCDIKHTLIGRWLAEKWQLPQEFVEAISLHHHPYQDKEFVSVAGIIQLSDILVHRAGIGDEPDESCVWPVSLFRALGMGEEYISSIEDGLYDLKYVIAETWGSLVSV